MVEVKNLEGLLAPYIGPKKKVISRDVSHFLAPGENYVSVVLKVDVVVEDEETGKQETVHAVGKCIHSSDVHEILLLLGKASYKREQTWYTEIIPTLQNFAKENGFKGNFDIFPELIAYRANLHGKNEEVDEDCILLMENLATRGFTNIERHVGFDYEGAKVVLKDVAAFHAIPIAIKLLNRQVFEEKIRKHLVKMKIVPPKPKEEEEEEKEEEKKKEIHKHLNIWIEALESREICKPFLPKLVKLFEKVAENYESFSDGNVKNEPFVSICHRDLWVNNTLQIFDGDRIIDNKLIDFQFYCYDSPGQDLLFFLWSSVQLEVIKEHFDDLLQFYHMNFVQILNEFGCDLLPFSYDKFEEELTNSAEHQILHTIQICPLVFGKKGEFAFDLLTNDEKREPQADDISDPIRDRIAFILQTCGEKGWI